METYKPAKGVGLYYFLFVTILYDALIFGLLYFTTSYILYNLLEVLFVAFNIYQFYYIILCMTLKYQIQDERLIINSIFGLKKAVIPLTGIRAYNKVSGVIKGIKLSGFGKNTFALGKSVISKIGTTNMYVTSSKNIIYLNTVENINFAISPEKLNDFEEVLKKNSIPDEIWEGKANKSVNLHKDKSFMLTFAVVSIIILVFTLTPFILYLGGKLPDQMPLNFDTSFNAVKFGTGKQFAFSQAIYGVLNMAILFCMYYASYFYAKYDKKSANKFIFGSLVIATVFLIMQFRVIFTVI